MIILALRSYFPSVVKSSVSGKPYNVLIPLSKQILYAFIVVRALRVMAFINLPAGAKKAFRSFKVGVPDQDLTDVRQLLDLSRLGPKTFENSVTDRRYGITRAWLEEAIAVWKDEFDWY